MESSFTNKDSSSEEFTGEASKIFLPFLIFTSSFFAALSPKILLKFKYFMKNLPLVSAAVAGIQLASMIDMMSHFKSSHNERTDVNTERRNFQPPRHEISTDSREGTQSDDFFKMNKEFKNEKQHLYEPQHQHEHHYHTPGHQHEHHHGHEHHHEYNHNHVHEHHNHDHSFFGKLVELGPFFSSGLIFLILLAVDSIYLHDTKHSHDHEEHVHDHHDTVENHTHEKFKEDKHHSHDDHSHEHKKEEHFHEHKDEEDSHDHKTEGKHSHEQNSNVLIKDLKKASKCSQFGGCNTSVISSSKTKASALITLFAISFHSIFEGLAVDPDKISAPLFIGLLLHKILESFSVGNSILNSIFSLKSKIMLIFIYSTLTPFSIFFRSLSFLNKNEILKQYFNGLCIGSLFFVVFYESIGHSFQDRNNIVKKNIYITTGFIIGCLTIVLGHDHSHH